MTDKVQKIREEVVRLKSQLLRGACSSQIAMETRCKEEAYDEVLSFIASIQEEPVSGLNNGDMPVERWKQAVKAASNQRNYRSSKGLTETRDDYFVDGVQWADEHPKEEPTGNPLGSTHAAFRTAAESLGISQEEYDAIVDRCLYGKEPELVDVDDLPVVVDAPSEDYVKGFAEGRLYEQRQKPVSETNKVIQKRRCLEEIASTINPFIDEVIEQFDLKNKSITAKEIQYRGVGLKGDFGENIHRSDDEIIYILKEDKTVGLIVIRRTEFNNAEITMVKTEERFKKKQDD